MTRRRPTLSPVRVLRFVLLVAAIAAGWLAATVQPAGAARFGMSDGRPVLFDSPHLHALDFEHVRLVLPWDAARRPGTWHVWLDRARLQGFQVLVAPTIDTPRDCESGTCTGPPVGEYRAALQELLAMAPAVTAVEAWNEPNHGLQPTWKSPALAAAYFDAAYAVCQNRCTAVAGNMLDGPSLNGYIDAYRAALQTTPAVWGIHNYFDATYFGRSGVDKIRSITDGPIWLTETGGLVSFRTGTSALPYDEDRAADSLRWLFTLAIQTPQIERAYLYGMWQQSWNAFDSALLREDNSERESMQVVRAYVGKRPVRLPGAQAPMLDDPVLVAAAEDPPGVAPEPQPGSIVGSSRRSDPNGSAAGRLRVVGKRTVVGAGRRVTVELRCVGTTACVGRLQLGAGGWRYSRSVRLAPAASRRVRVRLPRAAMARVNVRLPARKAAWIAVCDGGGNACAAAARVKLRRGA